MAPTYSDHDIVLARKLYGDNLNLEKGSVVIASEPTDNLKIVKRIGAVPGETIEYQGKKIVLAEDEYFLLGDNEEVSYDSRSFGPIKEDRIMAIVIADLYKKGS